MARKDQLYEIAFLKDVLSHTNETYYIEDDNTYGLLNQLRRDPSDAFIKKLKSMIQIRRDHTLREACHSLSLERVPYYFIQAKACFYDTHPSEKTKCKSIVKTRYFKSHDIDKTLDLTSISDWYKSLGNEIARIPKWQTAYSTLTLNAVLYPDEVSDASL